MLNTSDTKIPFSDAEKQAIARIAYHAFFAGTTAAQFACFSREKTRHFITSVKESGGIVSDEDVAIAQPALLRAYASGGGFDQTRPPGVVNF